MSIEEKAEEYRSDTYGDVFVATKFPYKDEEIAKSAVSDKSNVVATCKITWEE